jgi:hypothetical protein
LNTNFSSEFLKAGDVFRPKRKWKNSTKTDNKEVICEGVDWADFAQGMERKLALVKAVTLLWFP